MTPGDVRREYARRLAAYKVAERRVYQPGAVVRDEHIAQLRQLRERVVTAARLLDRVLLA